MTLCRFLKVDAIENFTVRPAKDQNGGMGTRAGRPVEAERSVSPRPIATFAGDYHGDPTRPERDLGEGELRVKSFEMEALQIEIRIANVADHHGCNL